MVKNDILQLYRGKDFYVTDDIVIRQPTIGEICDYGEMNYYQLLHPFVATPFDMIAQLDKVGIDFTQITDYQLFCLMVTSIEKEESSILFGDTDFTKYRIVYSENNNIELRYRSSVISEPVYMIISDHLRKMNNLSPPKYKTVGNEFTKQKMIEFAHNDLKYAARKKPKSQMQSLVSSLVNHPNFKYGINEIWDVKIYAFYDAIKRINIIENAKNLYTGMYSGCIDSSKISKKDFDWMRSFN